MLGISVVDRVPNVEIRRKTKDDDVGNCITSLRWRWAGHLTGRWTMDQRNYEMVAKMREKISGQTTGLMVRRCGWICRNTQAWMRMAQDRSGWRNKEEAYTQQWELIKNRVDILKIHDDKRDNIIHLTKCVNYLIKFVDFTIAFMCSRSLLRDGQFKISIFIYIF